MIAVVPIHDRGDTYSGDAIDGGPYILCGNVL
jgi:hypothetical protein